MIKLNAPKGLGDAIYMRAIALHLLDRKKDVKVLTWWPDVFFDLPIKITSANDYTNDDDLHHAMACLHCRVPAIRALDRFKLTCFQAQILEPVELRLGWKVRNQKLVDEIKQCADGRQIMLYQPRKMSKDGDQELTRPERAQFNTFVNRQRKGFFRVKTGHPHYVQDDTDLGCELDLFGKTSVTDIFDIAAVSDMIFGEASCFLPNLAESLDKPFTCMYARRGLAAVSRKRVWGIRPEFMIHKKHLATVIYDDPFAA
jgi:hypothetical protein